MSVTQPEMSDSSIVDLRGKSVRLARARQQVMCPFCYQCHKVFPSQEVTNTYLHKCTGMVDNNLHI